MLRLLFLVAAATAFETALRPVAQSHVSRAVTLDASKQFEDGTARAGGRRRFFEKLGGTASGLAALTASTVTGAPSSAGAIVFLDPARYGDQELRKAAIAKLKTRVREEILKDPSLGPAFFKLALSDALSYDAKTNNGGPDGSVLAAVRGTPAGEVGAQLKQVAQVIQESQQALKRTNALTFADLVALSGAEAIEAIGGPDMLVQLGRTDGALASRKGAAVGEVTTTSKGGTGVLPIDWNDPEPKAVLAAFERSGLTERETAVLLGVLLTLETSEMKPDTDMLNSGKGKAAKRGQMGRALSEKELRLGGGLSYEPEGDEEPSVEKFAGDIDDFLIVDSYGTKDERYGKRVKSGVTAKEFNKVIKNVVDKLKKNDKFRGDNWIEATLVATPGMRSVIAKYAEQNLTYLKDVGKTYDRVTQLGGVYTGGKYDSLLSGREKEKLGSF